MKTLCSWCKCVMKAEDGKGGLDSHGICKDCGKKYFPEPDASKTKCPVCGIDKWHSEVVRHIFKCTCGCGYDTEGKIKGEHND